MRVINEGGHTPTAALHNICITNLSFCELQLLTELAFSFSFHFMLESTLSFQQAQDEV